MREEDIPQVVEIEKIAFSRPWTKSIFKAALLLPYAAYYVAVEESSGKDAGDKTGDNTEDNIPDKVVGMCGVKKIFEEGDISNVAVHPAHRGRGISRKMLEILMSEARADGVQAFTLEVRAGNEVAVNLYQSLGFRTEGVRPRFYDDPVEDGLIMWQRPEEAGIYAQRFVPRDVPNLFRSFTVFASAKTPQAAALTSGKSERVKNL